jgi:probable rRNA maturation factor
VVAFDLILTGRGPGDRRFLSFLRRHVEAARVRLGDESALTELSAALVGDETMSALHRQFMGHDGPTDVLSFPLETGAGGGVTSGEVVICVPEAERRSDESGIPVEHELLLYALHGMLHLSGHDDRTPAGYRRMHEAEDRILTRLGVGAVFAPGQGTSAGAERSARGSQPRRRGGR